MIEKVIKIGYGLGPIIDMSRYERASLHISGLNDGEIIILGSFGPIFTIMEDCTVDLGQSPTLQVKVNAESCVVVKLRAEVA